MESCLCMQGLGKSCLYCGDGINDLEALANADVGMAVGSAEASAAATFCDTHYSIAGLQLTSLCVRFYTSSVLLSSVLFSSVLLSSVLLSSVLLSSVLLPSALDLSAIMFLALLCSAQQALWQVPCRDASVPCLRFGA